jgi:hypothetical protein
VNGANATAHWAKSNCIVPLQQQMFSYRRATLDAPEALRAHDGVGIFGGTLVRGLRYRNGVNEVIPHHSRARDIARIHLPKLLQGCLDQEPREYDA